MRHFDRTVLIAMLIPIFASPSLLADVTIVRQAPVTGDNQVPATWSKPLPEPEEAAALGQRELTGRLSAGGSGGQGSEGDPVYDFYTDSNVTLIQPLSQTSSLQLNAGGLRKTGLASSEQNYGGDLTLSLEKLSFNAAGAYTDSSREAEDVQKDETLTFVEASLALDLIPTLPMSLSYRSEWQKKEDDNASTEESNSNTAEFTSAGTLGTLGVELNGNFDQESDTLNDTDTLGTSGYFSLTVPTLPFLSVMGAVAPNYSRTEYHPSDSALTATSLESNLGFIFPLSETFEARLIGGRIDTWNDQEGSLAQEIEPHLETWEGEIGADLMDWSGFSASPSYQFANTVGGNQAHTMDTTLGWQNEEERLLRSVEGSGGWMYTLSDDGDVVSDERNWGAGLHLAPTAVMNLETSYAGDYRGPGQEVWTHRVETTYDHAPDPWLDYGAGLNLESTTGDVEEVLKHGYLALVNFRPEINFRSYSFGLSEDLTFSHRESGDDVLSVAGYTMAIPVLRALQARYGLEWEWVNRQAPGEDPGNNFKHLTGFSLSGEQVPFSLTTDYSFSHGYRGRRHDLTSLLQVPLRGGFSILSEFTLSHYYEDGEEMMPFLLSANLVYEF